MKLVTFCLNGTARLGALIEEDSVVLDLAKAHQICHGTRSSVLNSMQDLIDGGAPALAGARTLVDRQPQDACIAMAGVQLLSPLPTPIQMRDFLCFETHMRQAGHSVQKLRAMATGDKQALADAERLGPPPVPDVWYRQPIYYKCNRFAVAGTDTDIQWPTYSKVMDYELELAVVIGREGRDIPKDKARDFIFGYTIFNDFSARDAQALEMAGPLGPAKGKDFDGANILGPCIVTADEIHDPYNLSMIARVNGEEWSRSNSGTIHWTFEDMIFHVSRSETLYPGEILGSGTVGNGCGLELMRFLSHGDTVELEIPPIGVIRNRVVAPHTVK